MEAVVTVRHLCHAFGKGDLCKPVLDDVNLDIYRGEIVIMRGPSGSGKTTIIPKSFLVGKNKELLLLVH